MSKQDQSSGQNGSKLNQSELDTILRGVSFTSQSDANTALQRHGLTCQMAEDGTAKIFEGQQLATPVATVKFNAQQGNSPRHISGINY